MMRRALALSLLCLAPLDLAGCAEPIASGPPPSQSTAAAAPSDSAVPAAPAATSAPSVAASAGAAAPVDASPKPWADAVRMERWAEAAALLDALPESERERPEIRYVRARVALSMKDAGRAAGLLAGLEQRLPMIAEDIVRYRAEATEESGPFAEAAAYFARGTKARDFVRSARAFEKAGDAAAARQMAERAVTAAQRSKSRRDEAAARSLRARLQVSPEGAAAASDLRWIAVNAPLAPEAADALAALERLKQPLSMKEKVRSIEAMMESGGPNEAAAEVEKLTGKPGAPARELLHLRAMALYKARSYAEAAKAFQVAAAAGTGREAEELTYSAKALARSGKASEAVKRYAEVAARYKATPWGEQSAYLGAQLLLQSGRFKEAEAAYTKYLAAFPVGKDRTDAEVERALALLSAGNPKVARRQFALIAQKSKGDIVGKVRELEGVAALRAGEKDDAVRVWTDVVRGFPLSWAALTARSRLLAAGAPVPPLLEPGSGNASSGGSASASSNGAAPPTAPSGLAPGNLVASPAPAPAPAPPPSFSALRVELPPTAALLASLGLDADAEGRIASNERDAAAPYAGRESEALCGMYGLLSRAKRRYRVGVAAVSYSMLMRAPSSDERWAWECLYPRPYADPVKALEEQYGFPKGLLHAVMRQESAFDPTIVSPADAVGLIQLIPPTAMRAAAEVSMPYDPSLLTSPEANLKLGAFYLNKLLKMFQGSLPLAAASYNAGPKIVSHWLEISADNEADLWVARIPYDETRGYVARVVGNLARYQWLEGGDAAVTVLPLEIPASARAPSDAY
jgi:soluble lytic murein transglycosylase